VTIYLHKLIRLPLHLKYQFKVTTQVVTLNLHPQRSSRIIMRKHYKYE